MTRHDEYVPLGVEQSSLHTTVRHRAYIRIFGVDDFHSHIRWSAIRRYLDLHAMSTLEIGANTGVMTYALARRMESGTIEASEFDGSLYDIGREVSRAHGFTDVRWSRDDAATLSSDRRYDQLMAIDVLEHIEDDRAALRQLASMADRGATLVVSVPTPNYPEAFGREFHEAIGHVRDGYWFEDLAPLLDEAGFHPMRYHYYTRKLAARGCEYFYRGRRKVRLQQALKPAWVRAACLQEEIDFRDVRVRRDRVIGNPLSLALAAVKL